jgi:hypothetical protein
MAVISAASDSPLRLDVQWELGLCLAIVAGRSVGDNSHHGVTGTDALIVGFDSDCVQFHGTHPLYLLLWTRSRGL